MYQRDLGPYSEVYHEFSGHVSLDCTNLDIAIHVTLHDCERRGAKQIKEADHSLSRTDEL